MFCETKTLMTSPDAIIEVIGNGHRKQCVIP